jgi:sortase (surface protein transpeptidase)
VGHINYAGVTGVLAAVATVHPGDRIVIAEPHRTLRYVIAAVRTYPKTSGIPAEVFSRGGAPRLALITCGGPFDSATGNYVDNLVAYARPV